jgi:hypothetical protein
MFKIKIRIMWRSSHLKNTCNLSRPVTFRPRFATGLAFTLFFYRYIHCFIAKQLSSRYHDSISLLLITETRMKRCCCCCPVWSAFPCLTGTCSRCLQRGGSIPYRFSVLDYKSVTVADNVIHLCYTFITLYLLLAIP